MDGIRVGLIGFGSVASTLHVPLLRATAGYRVAAVTTSRPAEVAAALPDVELFDDPAAMARQPHLDLVVIATPNDTHAPLAEMVLRAGRHVVVDKPFALTAAEARRLGDVARTTGRVLSVFQNRRWDSDYLTVREAVRRGLVGRVVACESRYDRFRPEVRDRWRERAGSGSGLLYDLGSHLIDQALLLFGVPDTVQATLARQRSGAVTDDYMQVVLRFGEVVVTLSAAALVAGGGARLTLYGDRATLVKPDPDVQERQLREGLAPGAQGWGVDPDDAVLYDGSSGETRSVSAVPGDYREYYRALAEALHGRGPNPVPPEQGAAVMAVIDAARLADAEGRRVVPDIWPEERAAWAAVGGKPGS